MHDVEVRPVGPAQWPELERLFGPSGAYSGCWCMWFRISGREFSRNGNAGNRAALADLVATGEPVGLLGYAGGEPVGWAAVAPRSAYARILRSPALRPVDPAEAGVWSVPCFFIRRHRRRTGVAGALLDAAVHYARPAGAAALEGYPVAVAPSGPPPAAELYTGTVPLFERAGFSVAHRPETGRRVVMRRAL
ncbi:MAG TPA: GNAT family N-acetyltransferase [Micromonosporaceae bacterium]|nr:GNAT family N-acetyltransferase [Micromonosporaceae bacterium]